MPTRIDAIVVGAGAMGSSTAWWLARRGRRVVLLEQFGAGHSRGSSHGGSRIFRFAYPDPTYVRMAQAALPLWRELEDDAGRILLETTGAVDHGDAASVGPTVAALAACGAAYELLSTAEAAERWPHMRTEGQVLFHPDGGRCLADATVAALHERAAFHGADVRFDTGPAAVAADGNGVRVVVGDEELRAPVAVLTAGAWLPSIAGADLGLPLTVTAEQVQHFRQRDAISGASWPSFIHHRRPWVYGLFTPGEGMKVAEHHVGPIVDPDRRDDRLDRSVAAAMGRYVAEWFPGLDPDPLRLARCLYTTTATEDFVLDRIGPLVIGSPCSGHGFKFTPLIGRLLADLATGGPRPDARFRLTRR